MQKKKELTIRVIPRSGQSKQSVSPMTNIYDRFEKHLDIWPSEAYAYGRSNYNATALDGLYLCVDWYVLRDKTRTLYIPFTWEKLPVFIDKQ